MSIKTEKRMHVTIVSESLIETRLIDALKGLGVTGYSVGSVRGDTLGAVRASEWAGENVQIETLVTLELSDRILEKLRDEFLGTFAVVAYRTEVEVLRGDKF